MFTSVFPALETSKSPRKTGAQISYYKQKGWERKAGFYGQGNRQDNDFLSHVSVASLVHTEFPSAAFEERQNECFSAWKILRRDPKHVYMGQQKITPSKLTGPAGRSPVALQLGPYSMPSLGRGQRTKCQAMTQPITSA